MPHLTGPQLKPITPSPLPGAFILVLFLTLTTPDANAGMVYGQISGPREALSSGTTTLESSDGEKIRVRVDRQGRYRISLPPGDYRVLYQGRRSRMLFEGWLTSSPNASRQDIRLVPLK